MCGKKSGVKKPLKNDYTPARPAVQSSTMVDAANDRIDITKGYATFNSLGLKVNKKMFVINEDQINRLKQESLNRFYVKAKLRLQAGRQDTITDQSLTALLDASLAKARANGLASEQELLRFIDFVAQFGLDFEVDPARPQLAETLHSESPPWLKLSRLAAILRGEDPDVEERAAMAAFALPSPIETPKRELP